MSYTYDPAAFRDVFEHHFTFLAGFCRNIHRYAERLALRDTDRGRDWTYAELGADVARVYVYDATLAGTADEALRPAAYAPAAVLCTDDFDSLLCDGSIPTLLELP